MMWRAILNFVFKTIPLAPKLTLKKKTEDLEFATPRLFTIFQVVLSHWEM